MSLSTKILLSVMLIWLLILTGVYLGGSYVIRNSYSDMEKSQIAENIDFVHEQINTLKGSNLTTIHSWLVWPILYDFMTQKPTPPQEERVKWFGEQVQASTLASSNIDVYTLFNTSGDAFYLQQLTPDKTKIEPVSEDIVSLFQPGGKLRWIINPISDKSNGSGLISVSGRVMVFASQSVLNGDGLSPPSGVGLIYSYLTDKTWDSIRSDSKLDLVPYRLEDIRNDPDLLNEMRILSGQDADVVFYDDATMFMYTLVRDVNNEPILLLRVTVKRDINLLGLKTLKFFNIAMLITGIIFSAVLFLLLRFLIIRRLNKMNREIVSIDSSGDYSLRIDQTGHDELAVMSTEINNMLSIIDKSNLLLSDIINSMPSSIIWVDKNFKIVKINSFAAAQMDLPPEKITGERLFSLFPHLEKYNYEIINSINNFVQHNIEKISYTSRDGFRQYLNVVIYPLSRDGDLTAIRIDDITHHIRNEKILEDRDRLSSIGTLMSGISARVKTPIKNIMENTVKLINDKDKMLQILTDCQNRVTDALKNHSAAGHPADTTDIKSTVQEIQEIIEKIQQDAKNIAGIIQNLRTFSRPEEEEIKRISLHEGIDVILNLILFNFQDRINIVREYGIIPDVECYPSRINQVIMNIISNSVDAIPGQGEIRIKTESDQKNVRISIQDNGKGISSEHLGKIFDQFFTTKQDVSKAGSGMGLAIASTIVREHGGTIDVKSTEGKGTTFIITLPVRSEISQVLH